MDRLCRALCTVHSISAQISQEGIKCTKVKELLRSYCPKLYTVDSVQNNQTLLKKMKNRLRVYGQVVVLILYLEKKRGLFLDQSVKKIFISAKIKVLVIKPCVGHLTESDI